MLLRSDYWIVKREIMKWSFNEKYITSQSGMGAGTEFPISEKFAIQFNPYLNLHGIVLAEQEDYPERVFDTGLKLSLILKK